MNKIKLIFISMLAIFFATISLAIEARNTSHIYTFPDGNIYSIELDIGPPDISGTNNAIIRIKSPGGSQLGYAKFEVGYINPLLDVLKPNDYDSLKTLYVSMMDTRSAPPNAGKLLVAYLAKLAKNSGLPIALSAAWGSGIFWAKMGFVFPLPGEMIKTYPAGTRKPPVMKLSISEFLNDLEDSIDGDAPSYINGRLVMPMSMVEQWDKMSEKELANMQFPTLDYQKLYMEFGADAEQAKRAADKLRNYRPQKQ